MRTYGMVGGRVHPCDQPTVKRHAMRRCSRCGLTKPADRFGKRNGKPDSMCRECKKEYDRERYRKLKLERMEEERHFMERVM